MLDDNQLARKDNEAGVSITVGFDKVPQSDLYDVTPREVMLGESLLTPGLQTSVKFDSYIHSTPVKNFDNFKNSVISITLEKPSTGETMEIAQRVYRMDSRHLVNNNNERFTIRACDDTQLTDPATLVSKSWKCTSPSDVVEEVLSDCAKAKQIDVEPSDYPRDYIAENIHPFQVVAQQAGYALAGGDDPSFLHYMTYENGGTHKFKSLKSLSSEPPVMMFEFNELNNSYGDPRTIMTYDFPCDFDLMSDILNGIDANGNDINSLVLFDPINKSFSLIDSPWGDQGCGIGSGLVKMAITNENTAQQQDMCPDYTKQFLQKRQARMGLLEKDKITLRLTVPFNPSVHAGSTIYVTLYNKETGNNPQVNYGTGLYLVLHMFHHVIEGGLATTTMSCVSSTIGYRFY